jgi:hypothetical protein
VAVAQFYDHETEADLPKWLIAFNNPANAEVYKTRKRIARNSPDRKGLQI